MSVKRKRRERSSRRLCAWRLPTLTTTSTRSRLDGLSALFELAPLRFDLHLLALRGRRPLKLAPETRPHSGSSADLARSPGEEAACIGAASRSRSEERRVGKGC